MKKIEWLLKQFTMIAYARMHMHIPTEKMTMLSNKKGILPLNQDFQFQKRRIWKAKQGCQQIKENSNKIKYFKKKIRGIMGQLIAKAGILKNNYGRKQWQMKKLKTEGKTTCNPFTKRIIHL